MSSSRSAQQRGNKQFLPSYKRQHNTKWHIKKKNSNISSDNNNNNNNQIRRRVSKNNNNSTINKSFHSYKSNDDIDIPPTKWMELHCEGEPPSPRKGMSCNFWKATGLYVFFGGANEGAGVAFTTYNDVYTYGVNTDIWQKKETYGDIPYPRYLHLSVIIQNTLYVIAGKGKKRSGHSKLSKNESFYDAYELNLNTWTWNRIGNNINTGLSMILKYPLYKCFPLNWNSNNGGIIIFGGGSGNDNNKTRKSSSRNGLLDHFYLNLSSGTYLTPMASGEVPSNRYACSIVQHFSSIHALPIMSTMSNGMHDDGHGVNNCCFIMFGGMNGKQRFADTYIFFPNHGGAGKWERLETINPPTARYGHTAIIVNNVMMVVGGFNEGWRNDVHCLDLSSLVWYEPDELARHTLPPRESHISFLLRNNLIIFGGSCWPICRNDMQCLMNTDDIVNDCKRKAIMSFTNGYTTSSNTNNSNNNKGDDDDDDNDDDTDDNNSNSSDRIERKVSNNSYYKKQKLGGGGKLIKANIKKKSSSNDSIGNNLNSDYVFTNNDNGNGGMRSRSSSSSSNVDNNNPMIKLAAAPASHLKKNRPESPRTMALTMSMSPSYNTVKKRLSKGKSGVTSRSLNSSIGDYYSSSPKQRTTSPYTVEFDASNVNQSRVTFPSILGKNRNKKSGAGVFLTELDRSPSKSPVKRLSSNNNMMETNSSPIHFDADHSYESKVKYVKTNMRESEELQQNIESIRVPLMKLKKVVETGETNARLDKVKHDAEILNESKAINSLKKKEQKARLKVEEMMNALGEATKIYKENEKRVQQQQQMKDTSMKLQQEATDTINRLQDDLQKLYLAGDKISEEDLQLTQDITHLKGQLKKQREEKDNMKKKLQTIKEQRKLAEKEVEEQRNNIMILRKESEMLTADLKGRV